MFTPTSLIIFGLSKILPRVFRKTTWRQKQEHHRCALNHLKNDDLINAVQCNLNSRNNHPDYEKALVLKDILAMRIDAELSQAVTTETLLKKRAEDEIDRLKYEGYFGTFTMLGTKRVQHQHTINLLDEKFPERNGEYFVKKHSVDFGTNGFKRTIELGIKSLV